MKILTKKLGKGEINWKGVVIPRSKKSFFPAPGVEFDLLEGKTTFRGRIDCPPLHKRQLGINK